MRAKVPVHLFAVGITDLTATWPVVLIENEQPVTTVLGGQIATTVVSAVPPNVGVVAETICEVAAPAGPWGPCAPVPAGPCGPCVPLVPAAPCGPCVPL